MTRRCGHRNRDRMRCTVPSVAQVVVTVDHAITMSDSLCFRHVVKLLKTTETARRKLLPGMGPVDTRINWNI